MKSKIEILALIDRSGSMSSIMPEAVGAFNSFIQTQKDLDLNDEVTVTLASFDNNYEVVFDRVPLTEVPDLTVEMVRPRGMTALNDAIGKLVNGARYPERDTLLLIQTDGYENSSQEYTSKVIKSLIKEKEAAGWGVNFIGAGVDAFSISNNLGFTASKSYTVDATTDGMLDLSATMSFNSTTYRTSKIQSSIDAT